MSRMQQPSYGGGHHNPHPQYYPPPPTEPKYNQKNNYQYPPPSYPPPSVPPPSFTQSQSMGGGVGNINTNTGTNDKFNPRPKYRDLWAAILFLLHFAAFIAISVISLRNYAVIQRSGVQNVTLNWSTIWILLVCVGVGFVLSIIYLALAESYILVWLSLQLLWPSSILHFGFHGSHSYHFHPSC